MTTTSKLDEELNQDATCPPETVYVDDTERFMPQGRRTTRAISTNPSEAKDIGIRYAYIFLMTYGAISIFFSLIFGIIGFALAYYAWHEHKNGERNNGLVMAVISFAFSTLSYLVPVIVIVLFVLRVI